MLIAFYLFGYGTTILAQSTTPAAGGDGTGSGGSVSYIEGNETNIIMSSYLSGTFFLKVIQGNKLIKVFKIIKN